MKRLALSVCAAASLWAATGPAHSEERGWYAGAGLGYSNSDIGTDTINSVVSGVSPGATTTSITKNQDDPMYKVFLGYSFTSFLALEANLIWLGEFGFDATTSPTGTLNNSLTMWGGTLDVLGILPLGKSWRLFGRVGGTVIQSTAQYSGTGAMATAPSDVDETNFGWKAGAGIGYEFDSGVAFRAEYEYYSVDTALQDTVGTHVISGSFLYRFR
jgi:OOP family OmpA-OmpF porin